MSEHLFLTILSVMAQEIEMLRYQNEQLESANRAMTEQLDNLSIEVNIHAK